MNIEHARFNMIEQQIRPWGVLDPGVLSLLQDVRRENFVPTDYRDLAFADIQIPIGQGQAMMEPKLEARLLQVLAPTAGETILEIGTGSGYMAALLAGCGASVTSVDLHGRFLESAARRLREAGLDSVTLEEGDASGGWESKVQWDAILLTGSTPILPGAFENALTENGRLVAVVGQDPIMEAVMVCRAPDGALTRKSLFDTHVAPLVNTPLTPVFQF